MPDEGETFSTKIYKKTLTVKIGKYAGLSNASCVVRFGDTVVLVTVTASGKPKEDLDFFPLSVDYEEKFYASGRVPASFGRREGKPSDRAILTARVIDRSVRPLFPKDLRNEVSVVCTVMSMDPDSSPEIASIIGTSVALSVSDIPWNGPIGAVNVGLLGENFVINPSLEEKKESLMLTTVTSVKDVVTMVEASAREIPNEIMLKAIKVGHKTNKKIISFINKIVTKVGKDKFSYLSSKVPEIILRDVSNYAKKDLKEALKLLNKSDRAKKIEEIHKKVEAKFSDSYPDYAEKLPVFLSESLCLIQKEIVRNWLLKSKKRVDGRKVNEIRALSAEIAILPKVHGSAVFTRGQTQVLSAVTLGTMKDRQLVDDLYGESEKRYIHHYNFPAYSVGEAKPLRAPNRREIGHGALAEKALVPVIPSEDVFPYTIRVVSEVLSSNGSTSQGSVCASTLALMDAGVPISAPVAGISCGLVFKSDKNWVTMVDIQGIEDFCGDMDFKVAGTSKGITAIQVDVKIEGLSLKIIEEALEKTYKARLTILDDVILKTIKKPRKTLSKYAPKLLLSKVPVDKIKEIIGSGGKTVQKLSVNYDCKIEISDTGRVYVEGSNLKNCKKVIDTINLIVKGFKVGKIYSGTVNKVTKFGAFVELAPGKDGFCHISQIDKERVDNIDDVIHVGDTVKVKITGIDEQGKIALSKKDATKR